MDQDRIKLLGEYLRQSRKELGISTHELSRRSGVTFQTISRIENGEFQRPDPAKIRAMATALELNLRSVWDIIGYFDAKLPEPMPYLRAKFRSLPPDRLEALSRDVNHVLRAHGIEGQGRPGPGEDEFGDEPAPSGSSTTKGENS